MRNQLFALFCLATTFAVMQAFSFFRLHLSEEDLLRRQNNILAEKSQRDRLRYQVLYTEFKDYRQAVAEVIPHLEGRSDRAWQKKAQARRLASVTLKMDEPEVFVELSGSYFTRAKNLYKQEKYNAAQKLFSKLNEEFPFSQYIVESYFLLAESQYKVGDYRKCLETIETMMRLFPSDDLTGYVMLRMGQVFEKENRLKDAASVYQTVSESFKEQKLKTKAKRMLANLSE